MYINELWIKSMNKLKEDRSMFSSEDLIKYLDFYNNYKNMINDGVLSQIDEDMRVYKKYDAISMWVGDGGLIEHEPEFITELVKIFGIDKDKKFKCRICNKCKPVTEFAKKIRIDGEDVYVCFICYNRLKNVPIGKWNVHK